MANYLQICQSVHRKMRGGNAQPGSKPAAIPPASTDDQMVFDIVDAVPRAWENLQNASPSWRWMRRQGSMALVPNTRTYNLTLIRASVADYDWLVPFDAAQPLYINQFDSGATTRTDTPVWVIPYENWRGWRDRRPLPQPAQPSYMTEWPDRTLEFDPTPNSAPSGGPWQIVFDYRKTNQTLVLGTDTPELPARFHELIAWMAVMLVCETRNSTGYLMQLASREIEERRRQLENAELPMLLIDTRYA